MLKANCAWPRVPKSTWQHWTPGLEQGLVSDGDDIEYEYVCMRIYIYIYIIFIYSFIFIYGLVFRVLPPQWYGSPGSTPFLSICKLLAAFLRSSLVFARSLQHFWLPSSHLLGTCYLLDDLRSTHTLSKYLRATYNRIYMWHVLCIYFLFTTCVPSQHYMCLTYTVPTTHSNDTIRAMHTIRTLTVHTIPIIPIIHTTYTIHMKHTYDTYHTYNTKHTGHTYHTSLT